MFISKDISRKERENDAVAIYTWIAKLVRDDEDWRESLPMDNWKCLICSYFNNAFTLGTDAKRFDSNYHRSIFDILMKDYANFDIDFTKSNSKMKYYYFVEDTPDSD